jgi:hypothetical protein
MRRLTFQECRQVAGQSGLHGFTAWLYACLLVLRGVRWDDES